MHSPFKILKDETCPQPAMRPDAEWHRWQHPELRPEALGNPKLMDLSIIASINIYNIYKRLK